MTEENKVEKEKEIEDHSASQNASQDSLEKYIEEAFGFQKKIDKYVKWRN